jgi:hypothetical protein
MIFLLLPIAIQIAFAVHVIKNGRNSLWIMVIVFFSLFGCAAYFFVEIMPTLGGNRHIRTARAIAVSKLDPERALRTAQDQMAVADTAANRIVLADAFTDLDRHFDALPLYREALAMAPGADDRTQAKLANCLFQTGAEAEALKTLDALPDVSAIGEIDRRGLLRARILDGLGRKDEALLILADIVTRLPGEEARCRYAALLLEKGRKVEAQGVLEEIEKRMKRMDRTQRAAEADMYDWAMAQLKTLRVG